jgi:Malonate decarboxylase, alpha subunit, transporter
MNEIVDKLPRVDIAGDQVDFVIKSDRPFYVEPLFTRSKTRHSVLDEGNDFFELFETVFFSRLFFFKLLFSFLSRERESVHTHRRLPVQLSLLNSFPYIRGNSAASRSLSEGARARVWAGRSPDDGVGFSSEPLSFPRASIRPGNAPDSARTSDALGSEEGKPSQEVSSFGIASLAGHKRSVSSRRQRTFRQVFGSEDWSSQYSGGNSLWSGLIALILPALRAVRS